jgi:hypothetical protein
MTEPLFLSLDSSQIAREIDRAQHSVCYAAPGILKKPADALAALARRLGPELIIVCLDFDERVMRMGFGELSAVKTLREARIDVRSTPGLRTGLVVVDDGGYIFTPTALYLEAEPRAAEAPNAMRLTKEQAREALARLSPAAKAIAIALARTEAERQRIREQAIEVPSKRVADSDVAAVEQHLEEAPPVQFDIARQVRVFNSYLQYVELTLSGAAIQRRRLAIPSSILKLGGSKDFEGRLKTTFDLIESGGDLSSKALEEELNQIRKDFTRSLGKDHGRVVLKSAKPHFEKRLGQFRQKLKQHQERVEKELQARLDESRAQIVEYYLPRVVANPPDSMLGQLLRSQIIEDDARDWLKNELGGVFPRAEGLIQKMQLDVRYKDVTFETLNREDFLVSVKAAFPTIDWEKAYDEFRAAGEKKA